MSLSPPLAVQAPARRACQRATLLPALVSTDVVLPIGLVVVGLLVRLPHLWTMPRFTDETREVLRAVELLQGNLAGLDRLVNVDAYIGGLYQWLLVGIFWATGVSALSPRLLMAVAGAIAVGLTYLLARDLGGRLAGIVAGGLLATSGGQILSNAHIGWSHCLTPTLTTLAAWLLQRAVRHESRAALLGSGLAFGLAFQTHPATLVLLPGAAIYLVWWGRRWLRTPWPYLALGLFLLGFANVLVYNLLTAGNSFREAATVQDRYDGGIMRGLQVYVSVHGTHGLMLLRYLAGAVDTRSGPVAYLLDPTLWVYGGLAAAGLIACARRGAPLPLLLVLSSALIMPYFNLRKYVPISDGRYLMPLLPLAFAAIGTLLATGWHHLAARPAAWRIAAAVGFGLLVIYPLRPLTLYYGQEVAAGRTNEPLLRAVDAVRAARRPDEAVLLHRDLQDVKLEGGGTAFRSLRFLLMGVGIDDRSIDSAQDYARQMPPDTSALLLMDAPGFVAFERDAPRLRALGVASAPVVVPDAAGTYGAYRLERPRLATVPANPGVQPPRSLDVSETAVPSVWSHPIPSSLSRGRADHPADPAGLPRSLGRERGAEDEGPTLAFSASAGRISLAVRSHTASGAAGLPPDDGREALQATKPQVPVQLFASGMVNPRGLAFRADGSLIVMEAGTGGPSEIDVGRDKPHKYGRTGQIVRLGPTGDKFSLAKGLPSIVTAVNEECGPSAVAFIDDRTYVLTASGGWEIGDPAFHSGIFELLPDGAMRRVWDMTAYVLEHPARARREDPRADVPGGMAYGMAAMGGKLYVTDGNQEQVIEVDPGTGAARQIAEYPKSNRALTGIAAGPDGALYVAEWASNKVTRITLDGKISDAATKLRTPIGVTFGPDGAMYVVEFTGRVLRSAPVGEEQKDILVEGLRAPTAITFGPDGNLYVSAFGQGSAKGEGEILRLRLAPLSAAQEATRTANAVSWIAGLLVFALLMFVGWRFRQRPARPQPPASST